MQQHDDFPVDLLPQIIKNTIYEVHQITKAPVPLIGASVLGAISLVCQNRIDVSRPGGLLGPVSLFLLTIADSGERKSTVDKLLLQPIYLLEEQLAEKYVLADQAYRIKFKIANSEIKMLNSMLGSQTKHQKDTTKIKADLEAAFKSLPKKPVKYKLTINDTTPAAMKGALCELWNSLGIMSDEAGTIINGPTLNELPFINKMWDGGKVIVDRKNEPEVTIKNARLTLSLMIQPEVFKAYLERKGNMARGVGFFARCLIAYPTSTQGTRYITTPVTSQEHLLIFHKRLIEIARESLDCNGQERICQTFSPEAESQWIKDFNLTEQQIGKQGNNSLSEFKDYASKYSDNIARVSALLHYFSGSEGNISLETVKAATSIVLWYGDQYINLFKREDNTETPEKDAVELMAWLRDQIRGNYVKEIKKSLILQYGPHRLRNRVKLNELLALLENQGAIMITQRGKATYICENWAAKPIYSTSRF